MQSPKPTEPYFDAFGVPVSDGSDTDYLCIPQPIRFPADDPAPDAADAHGQAGDRDHRGDDHSEHQPRDVGPADADRCDDPGDCDDCP